MRFIVQHATYVHKLALFVPIPSKQICDILNSALGNPAALAYDWYHFSVKFKGTYDYMSNALPDDGGNAVEYYGKNSACLATNPLDAFADYYFYHVLHSQ